MGRVGVDMYPLQIGVALREVQTFGKFLGGSPTNVAVAAARYGRRSAVITPHRRRPVRRVRARRAARLRRRRPVRDGGARPAHAGHVLRDLPAGRLPALLLPLPEGARPGDPRRRAGPRRDPRRRRLLGHRHRAVAGAEPGRRRSPRCAARGRRGITVLDLDYRPMFWPSREEARGWMQRGAAARHRRGRQPRRVRDRRRRPRAARGGRRRCSTRASSSPSSSRARRACWPPTATPRQVEVPPVPVEVVNGLGAGDAFGGALCHGLLAGWDLRADDAVRQRRRRDRRRRGWPAPTPCRPTAEVEALLGGGRRCVTTELRELVETPGARDPRGDRRGGAPPAGARTRCSASTAG